MKNIILFIENYVPGGNDQIALDLINNLKYNTLHLFVNSRHDLRVICKFKLPHSVVFHSYNLINFAEIAMFIKKFRTINKLLYYFLAFIAVMLKYPMSIFSIVYFYMKFRNIDFDIFISNNGGYPGGESNRTSTIAASLFKNKKNFHIVHNLAFKAKLPFYLFENIYDYILDRRTKFICVSNDTKEYLSKYRNIKQSPVVIHNGVANHAFQPKIISQLATLKILNVANLDYRKNHLFLLKALAILKKNNLANIKLYILGKESEDGYLAKLESFIQTNNLQDWVNFEGFVDPKLYYEDCHIFILTSVIESFALVRVEAMSYCMPVISTNVGDACEQIQNDQNGYIVETIEELADKILNYYLNFELIKKHGEFGYKLYESKFTLDVMVRKYEKEIIEG